MMFLKPERMFNVVKMSPTKILKKNSVRGRCCSLLIAEGVFELRCVVSADEVVLMSCSNGDGVFIFIGGLSGLIRGNLLL